MGASAVFFEYDWGSNWDSLAARGARRINCKTFNKMTTLPIVTLAGDARARGRAHGEALRPLIQTHVARWLDWLGVNTGEPPRAYVEALVTQTNFRPAIERWTPGTLARSSRALLCGRREFAFHR